MGLNIGLEAARMWSGFFTVPSHETWSERLTRKHKSAITLGSRITSQVHFLELFLATERLVSAGTVNPSHFCSTHRKTKKTSESMILFLRRHNTSTSLLLSLPQKKNGINEKDV